MEFLGRSPRHQKLVRSSAQLPPTLDPNPQPTGFNPLRAVCGLLCAIPVQLLRSLTGPRQVADRGSASSLCMTSLGF